MILSALEFHESVQNYNPDAWGAKMNLYNIVLQRNPGHKIVYVPVIYAFVRRYVRMDKN